MSIHRMIHPPRAVRMGTTCPFEVMSLKLRMSIFLVSIKR